MSLRFPLPALLLTLVLGSVAQAQAPVWTQPQAAGEAAVSAERPAPEPMTIDRFQWAVAVYGAADYVSGAQETRPGSDDDYPPSYLGGGVVFHLGGLLAQKPTPGGLHLGVTAGYRGSAEYMAGLRFLGVDDDAVTHRHQAFVGLSINRAELLIGGGAVFTHLDTGEVGHGGSALLEGRMGTASGVYVGLGVNVDVYANLEQRPGDRTLVLSCFLSVGWKNLR